MQTELKGADLDGEGSEYKNAMEEGEKARSLMANPELLNIDHVEPLLVNYTKDKIIAKFLEIESHVDKYELADEEVLCVFIVYVGF